jgi:hypothetical protein
MLTCDLQVGDMKKIFLSCFLSISICISFAQYKSPPDRQAGNLSEKAWADSVFNSLSKEERIAQLIVI